MSVEVMIVFMIAVAGVAIYYYVQGRTYREINSDLRNQIDLYQKEIKSLDIEVSYWKNRKEVKKTSRKNKTK